MLSTIERFETITDPTFNEFFESWFWRNKDKWSPKIDIHETDKNILINIEIPGLDKKDIKIEVKNNNLIISGELKYEEITEGTQCLKTERRYGKFERILSLSDKIEVNKITASYDRGILKLILPKIEETIPKEIQIEIE